VRSAPTSREDQTDAVSSADFAGAKGLHEAARSELRPAGLHLLLGLVPKEDLGGQAEDAQIKPEQSSAPDIRLVQSEQARAGKRAATSTGCKAARALFLLRDNGELPRPQSLCTAGATPMALLVGATLESRNALGPHAGDPESVPASGASRRSLSVQIA